MGPVDFVTFVDKLASVAGEAILPYFRTALSVDNKSGKGGFDPVTEADRGAETAMRALIRKTFPAHGVIGDEFGDERADAAYVWVLDPIDGTKSFIAGLPVWGTLIGLLKDGIPVYGMMHQPFVRESFTGDGASARYSGPGGARKLSVRKCKALKDATLFTTSPLLMSPSERKKFEKVEKSARLSRYGGDCYSYCMVAAGYVDIVIEAGLNRYDVMPLIPVVEGAGGVITDWQGGSAANGGRIVAAGDKRVHEQALKLLAGKS
jgi:myo-inositol-1(or 4)-monophosphatase